MFFNFYGLWEMSWFSAGHNYLTELINNMKAIIAKNKLGYIGLNGELPWRSPDDLKHFKKLTENSTLLVGSTTYKKLPNLKNRKLIVFDRSMVNNNFDNVDWCIGGKKVYELFAHKFKELHISIIDDETIGDVEFPNLNLNENCKIFYYNFDTIKL